MWDEYPDQTESNLTRLSMNSRRMLPVLSAMQGAAGNGLGQDLSRWTHAMIYADDDRKPDREGAPPGLRGGTSLRRAGSGLAAEAVAGGGAGGAQPGGAAAVAAPRPHPGTVEKVDAVTATPAPSLSHCWRIAVSNLGASVPQCRSVRGSLCRLRQGLQARCPEPGWMTGGKRLRSSRSRGRRDGPERDQLHSVGVDGRSHR